MQRDVFNERLERRLKVLDASVPPASDRYDQQIRYASTSPNDRVRVQARLPLGIAAAVAVLAVAIATFGLLRPNSENGGAYSSNVSEAPASISLADNSGASVSPKLRIIVTNGSAVLSAAGDRVFVHLSITNASSRDDRLVGTSSGTATAGLYAFPACTAVPSGQGLPCSSPLLIPWMALPVGATMEVDGIVLSGFRSVPVSGSTVAVTLLFTYAAPVTVQIPLLTQWPTSAGPTKSH